MRRDWATTFPGESDRGGASERGPSFPALPFASCFAYLPSGRGTVYDEGRLLCARLKSADRKWLPNFAAQVWLEALGNGRFARVFGERIVLVPVPGSALALRACWVGGLLAWCLRELGLAAEVWPILRRRYAVRKSAFAAAGERPSVLEHYASFAIDRAPWDTMRMAPRGSVGDFAGTGLRLTLVDDVITRGRTLLAAGAKVHEAFPAAQIRAFALLRTLQRSEVLHQVLAPCNGEVRWQGEDARRYP